MERATAGRRERVRSALVTGAMVAYAVAGAWLVFGPAPDDEAQAVGSGVRAVESSLPATGDAGEGGGHLAFGLDDEELSNVLLFVPLPVLAAMRWRRRWWLAVPAGMAVSLVIEGVQLVALDHRSPTWDDVVLNSVGVLAAAGLVVIAGVVRRSRRG